jgi:CRP-like cAMP-binding protein
MIDASGALMLERASNGLKEHGCRLLLAHISTGSPLGRAVQAAGAFTAKHHPDWFLDGDHALEWAERQLLAQANVADAHHEIRIDEFALMAGLTRTEHDFMKPYLDRQLLPARSPLFRSGQRGDRLYLLARGAVSLVTGDADDASAHRRVVTLAPGVIFGESAMLEDEVHSMTAIAEGEVVLYSLSRRNLEAIRAVNADLYRRLILNLLAHLSAMLRMTAGVLRESSDPLR